mgnify:CR=1 FL=1
MTTDERIARELYLDAAARRLADIFEDANAHVTPEERERRLRELERITEGIIHRV